MPVQQIKANFVPKEQFKTAIVQADPKAMAEWIRARFSDDYLRVITDSIEKDIEALDNTVREEIPSQPKTYDEHYYETTRTSFDNEQLEQAIKTPVTSRPHVHSTVQYSGNGEELASTVGNRPQVNYTVPRANPIKPKRPLTGLKSAVR